jgi:hypothetical protein
LRQNKKDKIIKTNNMSEKTIGQQRVGADFNPDKNQLVDQIKNKAAEFIDLCEAMRPNATGGEALRCISIAQTEIETACMYAVKANFKPQEPVVFRGDIPLTAKSQ